MLGFGGCIEFFFSTGNSRADVLVVVLMQKKFSLTEYQKKIR